MEVAPVKSERLSLFLAKKHLHRHPDLSIFTGKGIGITVGSPGVLDQIFAFLTALAPSRDHGSVVSAIRFVTASGRFLSLESPITDNRLSVTL